MDPMRTAQFHIDNRNVFRISCRSCLPLQSVRFGWLRIVHLRLHPRFFST